MTHTGVLWRRTLNVRADRGLAGGVSLPPAGRHGLLLNAVAQPLSPALRFRHPRGADCPLAGDQPPDGVAPARAHGQGRHSDGAPSDGWTTPRQTVTTLRRTHCRVHPEP